jgi:HSP20 family protein
MAKNESESGQVERVPVRRQSSLSPMEDFFRPIKMLDDFFRPSRFLEDFWRDLPAWREERFLSPSVDVEEADNEYMVCVDLPGFNKEDIKVECTGNQLSISAERSKEETKRRSSRRYYGSFYRSFTLPQGVESDQICADYENGVLTVRIPRGEESRPRRIEVGSGSGKQISGKSDTKESEAKVAR